MCCTTAFRTSLQASGRSNFSIVNELQVSSSETGPGIRSLFPPGFYDPSPSSDHVRCVREVDRPNRRPDRGMAVSGQAPRAGKAGDLDNPPRSTTRHPSSLNFPDRATEVPGDSWPPLGGPVSQRRRARRRGAPGCRRLYRSEPGRRRRRQNTRGFGTHLAGLPIEVPGYDVQNNGVASTG
jgi:hypothetical protein